MDNKVEINVSKCKQGNLRMMDDMFRFLTHVQYSMAVAAVKAQQPPHGLCVLIGGTQPLLRKSNCL